MRTGTLLLGVAPSPLVFSCVNGNLAGAGLQCGKGLDLHSFPEQFLFPSEVSFQA